MHLLRSVARPRTGSRWRLYHFLIVMLGGLCGWLHVTHTGLRGIGMGGSHSRRTSWLHTCMSTLLLFGGFRGGNLTGHCRPEIQGTVGIMFTTM